MAEGNPAILSRPGVRKLTFACANAVAVVISWIAHGEATHGDNLQDSGGSGNWGSCCWLGHATRLTRTRL
ncbi:hypothetical protein AWZ03_004478 [Drosophila navojoa]|uniref:Uncharacterized protein n=1 Tax=Drosophila navojoa TaxID=7232 RepID=A0A484BKB3_DRONA|nr:hypothetical protein AWZ03_004478 [Drosophila navojoa]